MVQNLIHIKDIINNTEFIYNTEINLQSGFLKCFEMLKQKSETENKDNLKYSIYENYCEVFYDKEVIKPGWVWNSKNIGKNIIYLLTHIPIYNEINTETKNMSTQTNNNNFVDASTNTSVPTLSDFSSEIVSIDTHNVNENVETPILERISEITEWCYKELEHVITDFNKLTLGNGYAKNPFLPNWNDALTTELKEKLSVPNYGLKQTNWD